MDVWEKSTTVDPEVRAYVQSLVNAVGGQSTLDERYAIGDDAQAVLNDLLRWLRLYDDKLDRLDVKRCLAEANLVKGDLLEILALWPEEAQENRFKGKLALACLQLLVPLTWPIVLEDDKTTVNHHRHAPYLQLAQVFYKRSILHFEDAPILRTCLRVALASMVQPRRDRSRRDEAIIKLPLYLFRNIAMISQPQQLPSQGDENEVGRSATIEAFHDQDIFSYLLTIGSGANDEFQEQDVILLEILFHLLKGVDARKMFTKQEERAREETDELAVLMKKERAMHRGYTRHAPTRHNRFGTMIWVKRDDDKMSTVTGQCSITDEGTTLHQMDASKRWNRPKHRGRGPAESNETSDFATQEVLSDTAIDHLRGFVEDFLDSCFNPLFSSLRKAIERENDRVLPIHHRFYFYLASWFLTAEVARHEQPLNLSSRQGASEQKNPDANTFTYVAAVLDQETFVLLNRHMQRALDEKRWQDLHATLLCFTQILRTVQAMAESKDDEDQEIAENIQNRIFYEEATHDRIAQILRGYTNQGLGYLDAVTECVHVFVRMLEQYSKQNVDLQIRSKRRTRRIKKKKAQATGEGNEAHDHQDENEDEDAPEDERQAHLTVTERKFDFARFSAKFLTQSCLNTFVSLLQFYVDLTPSQLKRCHRYLYRLAFKHDLVVLLFRTDILFLLHGVIKGPHCLSPEIDGYKDWEQLVQQVFRRCIKWIERPTEGDGWREAAIVEMLFSKMSNTFFYLQNGYERVVEKKAPRPPAELGFKSSVDEGQKIPVIVAVMMESGKQDAVEWVKRELSRAVEEREAWEAQRTASMDIDVVSGNAETAPSNIALNVDTDDRKMALFKDKHLRLLLETVGMKRIGAAEDIAAVWIVDDDTTAAELRDAFESIKKAEFEPPTFDDGKTAAELLINKSSSRREAAFSETESEGETGSGEDELNGAMFPPNLREKRRHEGDDDDRPEKKRRLTRRNKTELTEEELQQRAAERKRKAREKNSKIKSQLFVTASDDESDAEADENFFRLEAERRKKNAAQIRKKLVEEAQQRDDGILQKTTSKTTKHHTSNGEQSESEDSPSRQQDDLDDSSDISDHDDGTMQLQTTLNDDNDDDDDDNHDDHDDHDDQDHSDTDNSAVEEQHEQDTPSTTPPVDDSILSAGPMKRRPSPDGTHQPVDKPPSPAKPVSTAAPRHRLRAGFIIDESDSE